MFTNQHSFFYGDVPETPSILIGFFFSTKATIWRTDKLIITLIDKQM